MEDDRMDRDRSSDSDRGGNRVYATEKLIKPEVPNIVRLTEPKSYQKYWRAWPVCDDGKNRPFIVMNEHEGAGIFMKILGDHNNFYRGGFLESKKDPNTKSKVFTYEKTAPQLFFRVDKNNDAVKKNSGWRPKKEYMFNIIDRDVEKNETGAPINWCGDNKHTKLLRMPQTAFDSLLDTRDNDGPLDEYDVNYTKKGTGTDTTHSIKRAGAVIPNAVQGPISEVEQAYEKYDLVQESRLSSATYFLKYLKVTIGQLDEAMGTHYLSEFEAQAAIEKEQWGLDNATSTDADGSVDQPVDAPAPVAQPTPAATAPPRMRSAAPQPAAGSVNMIPCPSCGAMVSDTTETCPSCKTQLLAPCDNPSCGKMFSTSLFTCPHCGKVYQ